VWTVGDDEFKNTKDHDLYELSPVGTWTHDDGHGGIRIDVDPEGNPWTVTKNHRLFTRDCDEWVRVKFNNVLDVSVGLDSSIWVIAGKKNKDGRQIFRSKDGQTW
jgi:hypothetical protein